MPDLMMPPMNAMMGNPFAMNNQQKAQPDPAEKIQKEVIKTLTAVMSQQAAEGYQHLTQMGVPMAQAGRHVLDQLMQMSGQRGQQDALMPPGQGQMPGQQQKPPQPPNPNPMMKNQDAPQDPGVAAPVPNMPQQQQALAGLQPTTSGGMGGIPTAPQMQPQFNHVVNGGFFSNNKMLPNGDVQAGGPFAHVTGPNMQTLSAAQGIVNSQGANQVEEKALGAAITPLTAAEKATEARHAKELAAGGFAAQQTNLKDQADLLDKNIDDLRKQMEAVTKNPVQSFAAGINLGDLHKQLAEFTNKKLEVQQALSNLQGKTPNFKSGGGMTHSQEQISLYNKARSTGKSIAEAKKAAGF